MCDRKELILCFNRVFFCCCHKTKIKKIPNEAKRWKKHTSVRLLPSKLDLLTSNHTNSSQIPIRYSVIRTCTTEQPNRIEFLKSTIYHKKLHESHTKERKWEKKPGTDNNNEKKQQLLSMSMLRGMKNMWRSLENTFNSTSNLQTYKSIFIK